jgi:hypothetical protein
MSTDRFKETTGPWPAEYLSDQSSSCVAVSPSDSVDLTQIPKAIYVGTGGNIAMVLASDSGGSAVTFKNVQSGAVLPVRPIRVYNTNTTATDIVALN